MCLIYLQHVPHLSTANPTWGDIFECCFKVQSSKLERLISLKRCKRDVRALSFELSKMSPQLELVVPDLSSSCISLMCRVYLPVHVPCLIKWPVKQECRREDDNEPGTLPILPLVSTCPSSHMYVHICDCKDSGAVFLRPFSSLLSPLSSLLPPLSLFPLF